MLLPGPPKVSCNTNFEGFFYTSFQPNSISLLSRLDPCRVRHLPTLRSHCRFVGIPPLQGREKGDCWNSLQLYIRSVDQTLLKSSSRLVLLCYSVFSNVCISNTLLCFLFAYLSFIVKQVVTSALNRCCINKFTCILSYHFELIFPLERHNGNSVWVRCR